MSGTDGEAAKVQPPQYFTHAPIVHRHAQPLLSPFAQVKPAPADHSTAVDGLSQSFRTIVPKECTADRRESPHFFSRYEMQVRYADVVPMNTVFAWLPAWDA